MKRAFILLALGGLLSGCSDQLLTTEPHGREARGASLVNGSQANAVIDEAVADALDRIVPALGDSPNAASVAAALRNVARFAGSDAANAGGQMTALEQALDRLERAEPSLAAEIDAIRLAVSQ